MSNLPQALEPDDDDLIEADPLTPAEAVFAKCYADPESETYGRATKSAAVAGYVQPHNAQWRLRRRPRIIAKIAEYQKEAMASAGKVLSDLEHQRLLALSKVPPDVQAANRASELMGKRLALWVDRVETDVQVITFDPALAAEAAAMGMKIIERAGCRECGLPVLEDGEPEALPESKLEPETRKDE